MSTGYDCEFNEAAPNEWYLHHENDEGSRLDPEYSTFGPFDTFEQAKQYLDRWFCNPGGYSISPHPDSSDTTWKID